MNALDPSDTLFFFVHSTIPASSRDQAHVLEILKIGERLKSFGSGYADDSILRIARVNGFRDDDPEPRPWKLLACGWPHGAEHHEVF